jgi:peptidoglycan endopeptidase LytF
VIRDLIGKPFKIHGRGEGGFDCYGCAIEVLKREHIMLPDVFYDNIRQDNCNSLMRILENSIPHEKLGEPEKNCIIELTVCGIPSHIGVYLGNGEFVHCLQNAGIVVDKLHKWKNRVKGYYRVKNGDN